MSALEGMRAIAIEPGRMPPVVRTYLDELAGEGVVQDLTPLLADMRMIKSAEELRLARHAGEVAGAMMDAGRAAIARRTGRSMAARTAGTRVDMPVTALTTGNPWKWCRVRWGR